MSGPGYGLRVKVPSSKRKTSRRARRIPVDRKIADELGNWGINKKTVGPIALTILIAAILHQLGVEFSLKPGASDSDARISDILGELKDEKSLEEITGKIPRKTLIKALRSVVGSRGILWEYKQEDIPPGYSSLPTSLADFLVKSPNPARLGNQERG